MFSSLINQHYINQTTKRICQGDILQKIRIVETAKQTGVELEITERILPYAVVLTQDCDLEQDFTARANANISQANHDNDKYLLSVLLCPAYPAEVARQGDHLAEQQYKMQRIDSSKFKRIKQNNEDRYHFITEDTNYQLPELLIDFKHYFSIPTTDLQAARDSGAYVVTISELFRESLSRRFSNYLSRIALPEF